MGTHYRGTAAEITALNAYIKLLRAAESVAARTHDDLPPGLTLTQFAILETLLHRGPLCQRALAGKLLKSAGNVTLVVANLEKRRLIVRQREDRDRRYLSVALTAKGRRLISELFPKVAAAIARDLAVLDTNEQHALADLCKKLGRGAA